MKNSSIIAQRNYTACPDVDMFNLHSHENYEIFCFLSGKAKYYVEGTVYNLKPCDILIMKKAEVHSLLLLKNIPYERIVINFESDAIVGDIAKKLINFLNERPLGVNNIYSSSVFKDNSWQEYLLKICESKDMDTKSLYLTVLLNELYESRELVVKEEGIRESISNIIEYINEHLTEDISLDAICKKFYISKTHINLRFKQVIGTTVWSYIKQKRLILAKSLLAEGMKPVEVCFATGFSEYNSFYKSYMSFFGSSPKNDYKKKQSRK